ncbi:MAG TPA: 2-oxo-4-hydroxy-4-carboxy-5-ureidoimidazoline decarboxylase [Roseiflexaceae bacterium]|nr:2-oxo-4-hydroxy-4-carboxy-5-ureidoimidazoline decarboxylase [Roseiflexaceae bacterium]
MTIARVRRQTKASILDQFRLRLAHSPTDEVAAALEEIAAIAWLRLEDRVTS